MSTSDPTSTQRAAGVKDTSVEAGQHVAGVAKDEMHRVGSETKKQAKDLYEETRTELTDQAAAQQKRVASGIRSLGDEFGAMSESTEEPGLASDLAHQAASRATRIADWLDQRDPGSLLEEVKGYARRSPGTFIAIAAVAGIVAGRLTRSVIAESKDSTDSGGGSGAAAYTPPTGVPPTTTGTGTVRPPSVAPADPLRGVDPDVTGGPR